MLKTIAKYLLLLSTMYPIIGSGQEIAPTVNNTAFIDSLINVGGLKAAKDEIKIQTSYYTAQTIFDSLPQYVSLVGSYKLSNNNWNTAISKAEKFVDKISALKDQVALKNAYLELANLYDDKGDPKTAYAKAEIALELAKQIDDPKKADLEGVYYNLGTKAFNMGNIALSKKHQLQNLVFRRKSADENHEMYYYTYNTMGRLMWYSGEPDSAMYYFKAAIKSIKKLDTTPWNQLYRPALLNGNIAVLLQAKGEVEEAIKVTEQAVNQLELFDRKSNNEGNKLVAFKRKLASIDNLGTFYNSIGEFQRAEKLIAYSYDQKKKSLDPNDINITISLMILGQANVGNRNFEAAILHLNKAIERVQKNPNSVYEAFCYSTLGGVYETMGENALATKNYTKGEAIFRKTLKGDYSKDFLGELSNMALFYSKNNASEKAIQLADEAFDYTRESAFKNTLQHYNQILTKAEVYYNIGDFEKSLQFSEKGMHFFQKGSAVVAKQDSIQIQYRKPKNILINIKSHYALTPEKDEAFFIRSTERINEAISILNQRKTTLKSFEDLSILIDQNKEVFSLLTQLYQEAYQLTNKQVYLNKLLSIHESSVYTRIRTRLNFKDISFANVPSKVLLKEKRLKDSLRESLVAIEKQGASSFFLRNDHLNSFLDSLKISYPKYYKMRYATLEESLDQLNEWIPANTTLVRYLFINDILYAYVADASQENLVQLNFDRKANSIQQLSNYKNSIAIIADVSQELYKQLWAPLAPLVQTEKVIIFPDAELFNLSFDLLCPTKIKSYKDFATQSLLAKHSISYNYSLLLLKENRKTVGFNSNFIAFAPEFNDDMKATYELAITDSINLDKTYLTLLPQPFSTDLVKKFSKRFKGNFFINEDASKKVFTSAAKEHKIIHIGTHAESNNVSPELSRLIFAKNTNEEVDLDENSLFTYEIYNHDFSSNLAILTACETGKPTYQAGEGMISLAHAFNYAGSESILTSLWMIDEKSSSEIINSFYTYLQDGMPKDKALQKAKLAYIRTADEQVISPQYWAGMVLMGNPEAITISSSISPFLWVTAIALLFLVLGFIYLRKRSTQKD